MIIFVSDVTRDEIHYFLRDVFCNGFFQSDCTKPKYRQCPIEEEGIPSSCKIQFDCQKTHSFFGKFASTISEFYHSTHSVFPIQRIYTVRRFCKSLCRNGGMATLFQVPLGLLAWSNYRPIPALMTLGMVAEDIITAILLFLDFPIRISAVQGFQTMGIF